MPQPTQQPPDQPTPAPDLTPRPNPILATPATVEACADDLRTPDEQDEAAGDAAVQFAEVRRNASEGQH